ncbi:MAG: hypothetical protein MJ059_06640 [Lachnospiraceae bacterium]|nr:hypothetical protein [Lachnospiraceae bacterium]
MEDLIRNLYFEDIEVGYKTETPGRTVTEADVVDFACLTGDFNQLHTDKEFAEKSIAGQRIAHGLLVWGIAVGLINRTAFALATQKQMRAMTGCELKFKKPTLIGDTVHVVMEVMDKIDTRPEADAAKVVFKRTVVNQKGDELIIGTVSQLIKKRGNQ